MNNEKNKDHGKDNESNGVVTLDSLTGTKWRLVGIVNAQTGALEKIVPREVKYINNYEMEDGEPMDCEKCYTLVFDSESTAQGWSVSNNIYVSFFEPLKSSSINIYFSKTPDYRSTLVLEPPTPSRYLDAFDNLTSYICYNNELKLYYNNNKNYLLYKLIQS
ncbi:MAG: hypothetical protein LBP63_07595 [Prevotellaceae bacterium]|nr:hypothetical protein [Prevotellaceae bacterium]